MFCIYKINESLKFTKERKEVMESENKKEVLQNNDVAENNTLEVNNEKNDKIENRCPNCQALLGDGQAFCSECGTQIKRTCQRCGAELKEGQDFCTNCGQKVDVAVHNDSNQAINQFNTNVAERKNKGKIISIVIGVFLIIVIVAVILFIKSGNNINFEEKFADIRNEYWCEIATDNSYMKIDTNPFDIDDYFEADAWDAIEEVNTELGFSEALMTKMGETRSVDGRQEDENDKFRVSWTYHPDNGLEVIYEKK